MQKVQTVAQKLQYTYKANGQLLTVQQVQDSVSVSDDGYGNRTKSQTMQNYNETLTALSGSDA